LSAASASIGPAWVEPCHPEGVPSRSKGRLYFQSEPQVSYRVVVWDAGAPQGDSDITASVGVVPLQRQTAFEALEQRRAAPSERGQPSHESDEKGNGPYWTLSEPILRRIRPIDGIPAPIPTARMPVHPEIVFRLNRLTGLW